MAMSEIVFLGTGSSAGTPMISCLVNPNSDCVGCHSASKDPQSKNNRGNPSLLICYRQPIHGVHPGESGEQAEQYVIIDTGKTFKRAACRFFPEHKVSEVHAVVLTHEHSDAILGLDDLREVKPWGNNWRKAQEKQKENPVRVYCHDAAYAHIQGVFPYLTQSPAEGAVLRMVSQLDFKTIGPFETFTPVDGLPMKALPTVHGEDCCCFGFDFGGQQRVVYLSDFSRLPDETVAAICERHVDVLVLDSLHKHEDATTHIGMPTALELAKKFRATRTLLVGMSHSIGDHDEVNKELASREDLKGLDVQLAFDGLSISLCLGQEAPLGQEVVE